MLRFLKTTLRGFGREKLFTSINVLGLTLGTSCALLLFMIARHDLRFDTFHEDSETIYRVNMETLRGDDTNYIPTCPGPTGPTMVSTYGEITEYVRVISLYGSIVEIEDQQFMEDEGVAITEAPFFDMFNFPLIAGDSRLLDQPNQVIITERWAKKYFGDLSPQDLIGQQFVFNREKTLQVAGIMKDIPSYTDLPFEMYISEASYDPQELGTQVWPRIDSNLSTFVRINKGTDTKILEEQFPAMLTEHASERMAQFLQIRLQPLSTIHFDERYGNYNQRTTPPRILWGLFIIAAVLLITACINFINLSTANAIKRSKEVGIRKVLGVSRMTLIGKFVGETSILTIFSVLLAIPVTLLIQPGTEAIIGYPFDFNITADPFIWVTIGGIALSIIVLSGIYPAIFMAQFDPSKTLKSTATNPSSGGAILRKGLVIMQFVISQTLLIGLFVIQSQLSYFIHADMGFDKEGVLTLNLPQDKIDKGATFKSELSKISSIEGVSLANGGASAENIWMNGFRFEGAAPDAHHTAEMKLADEDYLELYGLKLLAGRNFHERDTLPEIVVNRALIEEMGISDPEEAVGQFVSFGRREDGQNMIVGVMENFNTSSLYSEVGPVALMYNPDAFSNLSVKMKLANISSGLEELESTWNRLFPNDDFNYMFMEDQIRQYYEQEQRLSEIIMWFTIVALFIGAIGLYGLVTYVVNQRMKELGIRKVMGASFAQLFRVISNEFVYLVAGAFVLAAPLAWYFGSSWLEGYENRIDLAPGVFVMALIASIGVAFLSILHKSLHATRVNPVETLRDE